MWNKKKKHKDNDSETSSSLTIPNILIKGKVIEISDRIELLVKNYGITTAYNVNVTMNTWRTTIEFNPFPVKEMVLNESYKLILKNNKDKSHEAIITISWDGGKLDQTLLIP